MKYRFFQNVHASDVDGMLEEYTGTGMWRVHTFGMSPHGMYFILFEAI